MEDVNKIACEGIKKSNIKLLKDVYGVKCCDDNGELKKLLNLSILTNNPDCACLSSNECDTKNMESCIDSSFFCPDISEATPDIKLVRCSLQWNLFIYKTFDSNSQVVGDFKEEWEFIPVLNDFPGKTTLHPTTVVQTIDRSFLASDNLIKVTYVFDLQSDYDNLVTAFNNLSNQLGSIHRIKVTGLDLILPYDSYLLSIAEIPASKEVVITLRKVPSIADFYPTDRLAFWGEFITITYDEIYKGLSLYSGTDIIETTTFSSNKKEKDIPNIRNTFDQMITQTINGIDETFHLVFKPDVGYNCADNNEIWWLKNDGTQVKVY